MRSSSRLKLTTVFSLLLLLIVGLALLNYGIFPAHAAGASISLSLTYGPPTTSVQVKGQGFKSYETVILTFDTTLEGKVMASGTGAFAKTITIPSAASPGNHIVQARGNTSGFSAQATFLVRTNWVQLGFNREHMSYNVFENVLNSANVSRLTQNWTVAAGAEYSSSVAVANGMVYVSCSNSIKLCAFNADTGQFVWIYATGNSITSSPAVSNGIVYIGSQDDYLYALNAATGQLVWSHTTGNVIVGSPLVANGLVYIGSNDRTLYALNAVTGKVVWRYTTRGGITGSPGTDNGVVYVGSNDGSVYALSAQTGTLKWRYMTKGSITSTPAIANGVIYMGSNDGSLYALNAQTGVLIWSRNSYKYAPDPSIANGIVYISVGCDFDALNAISGALVWSSNTTNNGYCAVSTPVIANGVVYADGYQGDANLGEVFMFTATTGAWVGRIENSNASFFGSPPVIANGIVYCITDTGSLYTYHLPAS